VKCGVFRWSDAVIGLRGAGCWILDTRYWMLAGEQSAWCIEHSVILDFRCCYGAEFKGIRYHKYSIFSIQYSIFLDWVTDMQKKALVVDNDFFFVEFLTELLVKRGYQVVKAYNGKQGIAKLENETFDILFADLILPKVDGRQFFKFIRDKYNGNQFPMVALSGSMIEQLGSLHEIGADYFIAKGPIDKLTVKLNEFMAEIETGPPLPSLEKKVLAAGNVYPRRDAMELMNSLHFHQAVIACAPVGIITVDDDTRIINANSAALEIIGKNSVDVLNCPVTDLFASEVRAELINGLKLVKRQAELKKFSFYSTFHSRVVGTIVATIALKNDVVGWIVVLEPAWHADSEATPA
jgi:PAS domain S-box-containing protein